MKYYWLLVFTTIATVSRATDYTIETSQPRQTIRHFGASDAWSMQSIGLWDNEAEQEKIADWLFSTENDAQGQPKGIGLSVWRFNLGAGSAEQGRESQINPGTRTECFLTKDGTYDWTKQPGQRKFLRMAKQRGVPHFLAFLNSAPVYFTQNGLATNTGRGGTINLKDDCYDDFARFMATSLKGGTGITKVIGCAECTSVPVTGGQLCCTELVTHHKGVHSDATTSRIVC